MNKMMPGEIWKDGAGNRWRVREISKGQATVQNVVSGQKKRVPQDAKGWQFETLPGRWMEADNG